MRALLNAASQVSHWVTSKVYDVSKYSNLSE
jgi:hypothetical protein